MNFYYLHKTIRYTVFEYYVCLLQIYPDPESEKAIMGSVVYCIHHKEGCQWSDELRKLKVRFYFTFYAAIFNTEGDYNMFDYLHRYNCLAYLEEKNTECYELPDYFYYFFRFRESRWLPGSTNSLGFLNSRR